MRISPRTSSLILLATLCSLTTRLRAAVPETEDLSACRLPHGELVIPITNDTAKGSFAKLSDNSLIPWPTIDNTHPLSPADVGTKFSASNIADLGYLAENNGTLWAISGRLVDLGTKYLYQAALVQLDRPMDLRGNANTPAGLYPGIQEGRTFLVETTTGRYALVRLLDKTNTGLRIQYVLQSNGSLHFDIPKTEPIIPPTTQASPSPESDTSGLTTPLSSAPGLVVKITNAGTVSNISNKPLSSSTTVLEPYLSTFLAQRDLLIQRRMDIVAAPAATPVEISRKIQAIEELVTLHADPAADLFAQQIAFLDTRGLSREFTQESVHPCFSALKRMGRPGVEAALRELRQMPPPTADDANTTDGPLYRAGLLALVIRSIEGDQVADLILKLERDKTTDTARRAMYDHILSPKN